LPAERRPYIGVIGAAAATEAEEALAHEVGERLARGGAVVVCGGRGGVMEAVSRGVHSAGGTSVGLLPGDERAEGNQWLTIALATGLGELRNGLIVRTCDALVAIGGAWGTLSEIAFALRLGRKVFTLESWEPVRVGVPLAVSVVATPQIAAERALEAAGAVKQAGVGQ
jgi:uncharacterized protein (TIGR00725 family)